MQINPHLRKVLPFQGSVRDTSPLPLSNIVPGRNAPQWPAPPADYLNCWQRPLQTICGAAGSCHAPRYFTRVRRRWINSTRTMTNRTPAVIRIIVVVSIELPSSSLWCCRGTSRMTAVQKPALTLYACCATPRRLTRISFSRPLPLTRRLPHPSAAALHQYNQHNQKQCARRSPNDKCRIHCLSSFLIGS